MVDWPTARPSATVAAMSTYRATRNPDDTISILLGPRANVPIEGDLITLDRDPPEEQPDTLHLLAHGGRWVLCSDPELLVEVSECTVVKAGVVVDPPA